MLMEDFCDNAANCKIIFKDILMFYVKYIFIVLFRGLLLAYGKWL